MPCNNIKHNMCYTRINRIYRKMKGRCLCPTNPRYKDYGGRGIKICDDWLGKDGFIHFNQWAEGNGYSEKLSLDRIDVNGNYEPSNCRWADKYTQANNTRANWYITYNEETHTVAEWSRIFNIPYETFRQRLKKLGWSFEEAVAGRRFNE